MHDVPIPSIADWTLISQANAQLLAVGTIGAGALLAFTSLGLLHAAHSSAAWVVVLARWTVFVGGVLLVLGLLYALYAFSPDGGR